MQILKMLNSGLMFFLELGMLSALGYVGFTNNAHPFGKYLAGIGMPVLAAVLWGIFAAPRSGNRLEQPYPFLFGLTLFGITAWLLYWAGYPRLALLFGGTALVCELLTLVET